MQEKDLHKLGKTDLLTLIYKQEKQIKRLTKEVEDLKQQLDDRTIQIKEAGSIAEASLKINKIFEVAQQAADEYLRSIKEVNKPSHECAGIDEKLAKDEAYSQSTYEKTTNDKISKELILINNKIMVQKPKLLEKVLILLMYIGTLILKFAVKTKDFTKRAKFNIKIYLIKLRYRIVKLIDYMEPIYDKIDNHMIGFVEHCQKEFPVAIKIAKYELLKFYNYTKYHLKRASIFCIKQLKIEIVKAIKFLIVFCQKILQHLREFVEYCNIQITIFKFKIRNIKIYKTKLLNGEKEENKNLILYKINILNVIKQILIKTGIKFKNKSTVIFNNSKKVAIKILTHLKEFCIYCKEQLIIFKIKITNKIHHVKLINEKNENIHIEETRNGLILTNNGIVAFKYKLIVRILILLQRGKDTGLLWISKTIKTLVIITKKINIFIKNLIIVIKEKKKLKDVSKLTKQALEKQKLFSIKISIPDLEKEIKKRKNKSLKISFIRTLAYSAMVIIAFAIITSTSFFKILQVSGTSMEPTLHEGELLLTSKFFEFKKGDMIAFYYNDNVLIKRVIATENDTIYIDYDGTVYVNSVKLKEEYIQKLDLGKCDITFPYQVPKNSVFILGDNRETSVDSRSQSIGCISIDKIVGKIQFKLNPFVIY